MIFILYFTSLLGFQNSWEVLLFWVQCREQLRLETTGLSIVKRKHVQADVATPTCVHACDSCKLHVGACIDMHAAVSNLKEHALYRDTL